MNYEVKMNDLGQNFYNKNMIINQLYFENEFEVFSLNKIQKEQFLAKFYDKELCSTSNSIYIEYKYSYLDLENLEISFNKLIDRHLALRTILFDNHQIFLRDYNYYKIKIYSHQSEEKFLQLRKSIIEKEFQSNEFPSFDLFVSKINDYIILHLNFNNLILDIKSIEILFHEWTQLYLNPNLVFEDLDTIFLDYQKQKNDIDKSNLYLQAKDYWEKKFDDYVFDFNLPLKCKPSLIKKPNFLSNKILINNNIWNVLKNKINTIGVSKSAFILDILSSTLSYWSGQSKLGIQLNFSSRNQINQKFNQLVENFSNSFIYIYDEKSKESINNRLIKTQNTYSNDLKYSFIEKNNFQFIENNILKNSIDEIISPIKLTCLFDDTYKNNYLDFSLNEFFQEIQFSYSQTSQTWIDLKTFESEDGLVLEWNFVEQLFDTNVIQEIMNSFSNMLINITNLDWECEYFPKYVIPNNDLVLINSANDMFQEISEDTLFSKYEEFITKELLGNHISVIDASTSNQYTYQQLKDESEIFSKILIQYNKKLNITHKGLIGILSEKGYSQVISAVSIMKSGNAYLPLHIDWPIGRLIEVLDQGNVKILLISRTQFEIENIREVLLKKYEIIVIEDILSNIHRSILISEDLKEFNLPDVKADDIAYVIFTSGSTGKPKGVTISHKGALNTIDAINNNFSITNNDKILALSELSFDLSVYDIFGTLSVGGTIVFPDQNQTKDPRHWLQLLKKYQISIWNTVPQLASLLIDEISYEKDQSDLIPLRLFLLSGDWIPVKLPMKIKEYFNKSIVTSLGGATEGSIWSCWYEIKKVEEDWSSIPYGIAMPNQKMFILNHNSEHCPVGVIGEIHIGGVGVALNYWGNMELTNERFFEHEQLGRLYKTGDLGCWQKNGTIQFIGRKDFQVKIRGYRIELGEIESALTECDGVEKCAVLIKEYE
jgi:amino acid adenylation domain-containing protein